MNDLIRGNFSIAMENALQAQFLQEEARSKGRCIIPIGVEHNSGGDFTTLKWLFFPKGIFNAFTIHMERRRTSLRLMV
ncbi:hypothetical protein [Endozoicomonas sp. GU-1]|uniref:hypothetical protein n=1 Tax=Endozoicomonas sp. GU-1 TaxID=3009078 RepID=UPI0022B2D0CC|nr:hypothetical protein [Endozoicomonas sp. GU-1]WBA83530.1 hypothetical protein O2T12_10585 [Endozoicomonas sp. GU-1]WBA86464.1 hypothetical protein O3276_25275 [Endozoicomonas sp. GU-1]